MAKNKYVNLRDEDHLFLLELHDFIYLHKEYLDKYLYQSYTNKGSIYRRLRDLEDAGYINSFTLQVRPGERLSSKVFTLGRAGVETVEQLRGMVHWNPQWSTDVPRWYQHQLMIAETVKEFQIKAPAGFAVKEWITEARAFYEFPSINKGVGAKTKFRPDGILIIGREDTEDTNVALLIEMERSYATRERTLRKIDQFNAFFSRYDELFPDYDRKVGFEHPISGWKLLFVGGTHAKVHKLLRDLGPEQAEIPVIVAAKEEIDENPYRKIYRDSRAPEDLVMF